jgi:DNA-binding transcriptional ArsR family regulator
MTQSLSSLVRELRAIAEPTRLRMLAVLARGEFSVSELTEILGQSQPRVSRHLKVLGDCGLLERFREQHWIYYRVPPEGPAAEWVGELLGHLSGDDALVRADRERVVGVLEARRNAAPAAADATARTPTDDDLAAAIAVELANASVGTLLYLGRSPGSMLARLAPHARRVIGVHPSRAVLQEARAYLHTLGLTHCVLQHAEPGAVAQPAGSVELAIVDRVLAAGPGASRTLRDVARALTTTGQCLLVADFDALDEQQPGENPLLVLRRWVEDAGWSCRRIRPVEAGHSHLLVASAHVGTAQAAA